MSEKPNPFVPGAAVLPPSVDAGLHPGILVGIYHLGTHIDPAFNKKKQKLVFVFELPMAAPVEIDGKTLPRTLSKSVNATMGDKGHLRPMIESWRGKKLTEEEARTYDITKLLGRPCQLNVIHSEWKEKIRPEINGVFPSPKDVKLTPKTQPVSWAVGNLDSADELDQADIADWIKDRAAASEEYKALRGRSSQSQNDPQQAPAPDDGDVPF